MVFMRITSLFLSFSLAGLVIFGASSCAAPAKTASADDWRGRWGWNNSEGDGSGLAFELADAKDNPLVLPFLAYQGTLYQEANYVAEIKGNTLVLKDPLEPATIRLVLTFDGRQDGPADDVLVVTKAGTGWSLDVPSSLPERFELTRDGEAVAKVMAGVQQGIEFEAGIAGEIQSEQAEARAAGLSGADFPGTFQTGVYSANEGFSYLFKDDGVLMRVLTDGASVTSGSQVGTWEQTVVNAESGDRMLKVSLSDEATGETAEALWDLVAATEFQTPDGTTYRFAFNPQ